jgi:hypothetical protein
MKVNYCVNKSLPLVPILSQMYPVHTLSSCFSNIHYNIILPSTTSLPSCLFLSGFNNQNFVYFSYFSHACYMHHLILLCLITLIIFTEEYKVWSSPLCSFLQPPVTSRSKCYPQKPVLKCSQSMFFPYCVRWSFTPIKNR